MADQAIDRYQIREKIGAGGMGTVYRAWDNEIERDVALKWLPAYFSADVTFTERFKREARVVARLEHPHIVPIYDVGESEGRPFIIMRLLSGGTLREQTGKPGFDLAALFQAMEEIGDALSSAHARQIIHRDIKPGNILFDDNGSAFLSDFGIAKVLDSATQLTGSGFIGTPSYMSPEQFIAQNIDGRSDQYSLAIVVFESLTGSLPFKGNTAQMMYKHINAAPPEINLNDHPIPEGLNPVLQKAMSKDPNDRYARIKDFVTAIKVAIRDNPAAAFPIPLAAAGVLLSTPPKPATAPTALDTPSEPKTDQLQQDYRAGLEGMSRSQWAVAIAAFDRVLLASPEYGNAAEFKRQAEAKLEPVAPTPAVDEPSSDSTPAVVVPLAAAAAAKAATSVADLEKTSLDLPPAAEQPLPVDMTEVEIAQIALHETTVDLPPAAEQASTADMTEVEVVPLALHETTVDLAPAIAVGAASLDPPPASAAAPLAAAQPLPSTAEAQETRSGRPLWAIAVAVILLLLLCGGGVYAGVNFFGGGEDSELAAGNAGNSDGGSVVVAAGNLDSEADEDDEGVIAEPTSTAEPESTEKPLPEPTERPLVETVIVIVMAEESEVPPTPTESPTATAERQFPIVRVNVSSANLRSGPGTIYPIRGAIFLDERLTVLAKNRDGSWYNVELKDESRAWIAASVTELVNDVALNNVSAAATIPVAPTLTPVPPTWTPLPLPTLPPPTADDGGGGGGGGDDDDGGGGDGGGGGSYTREAP